jgi:type I restriction enzyme S subunit
MNELPRGWAWTTLGEIGDYLNGRGFKKSEWRESGRPIIRIQNLTGSGDHFNYFDGEPEERYIARDGDLLVSWAATLGVFVWRGPEAVVNQHIFKVASRIDRGFLRYLLLATLGALQRETHGSGMVHITKPTFDATSVALPPLNEQRRIVAAIEEQFSRLDVADASLDAASLRLDGLAARTVGDAVSGDWPEVPLREVTRSQVYGTSAKANTDESGVPVLRMGNIQAGRLDLTDLKYLPFDHPDISKLTLQAGDLLFNRTNSPELVGKSAVFESGPEPTVFASYLIRVQLDSRCDPKWAALVINGPGGRRYIASVRSQQVGQANVNGTKLAAIPIPLPLYEEQQQIVAGVEQRLSVIDAMRSSIDGATRRSAVLRRSILERAFRGELVEQDLADEPASVLLRQICAGRAEGARTPKRRRVSA